MKFVAGCNDKEITINIKHHEINLNDKIGYVFSYF